jgi:hypothetical protein
MLKCRDVAHQATDYVDRELSRGQALGMLLHLLMCANCRRFMQFFRISLQVLKYKRQLTKQQASQLADQIIQRARSTNR